MIRDLYAKLPKEAPEYLAWVRSLATSSPACLVGSYTRAATT